MLSMLNTLLFLFLSIVLTKAVQLDGNCDGNNPCDANLRCVKDKCQCETPWYKPCKTGCELNPQIAYEGDSCRDTRNCIGNTICNNGKCVCSEGFTAKEGACLKDLDIGCINNTECRSYYCFNSKCDCPPSYKRSEDGKKCEKRLFNVYTSFNDASKDNAFCQDSSACIDILAECTVGPENASSKYCRCPDGYLNEEKKRCVPIKSSLLSPINSILSTYPPCGSCNADNAACISVAGKRTCWCRAGYFKNGDKCEKQRKSSIIFPTQEDSEVNDFTNGCNENNQDRICACKAHYKFVEKDSLCQKIEPKWIDDVYEYGLCTQINSKGSGQPQVGICAEGLKCEAKNDKHVCTCGAKKFLDLQDTTRCVYYIGEEANVDNECPTINAIRNGKFCECVDGFKPSADNRTCVMTLSSEMSQTSCNLNTSKNSLCQSFGRTAYYCNVGECRCGGRTNETFMNNVENQCNSLLNTQLSTPIEFCPPSSTLQSNRCICNAGYRPSIDLRQCDPYTMNLMEYIGSPQPENYNLTTNHCKTLFTGVVEGFNTTICQCINNAFLNENNTGCWYKLNVSLNEPRDPSACPPYSSIIGETKCLCKQGYAPQGNKCIRILTQVYIDGEPGAKNVTAITDSVCINVFGRASIKSTKGDYCICRPGAYAINNNAYCLFKIDEVTSDLKDDNSCPEHATFDPQTPPSKCICTLGYYKSSDNRTCVPIDLSGVEEYSVSNPASCDKFTNDDCKALFGENAFCKDNKCYCNRRLSFKNDNNKCESFSNFKFPGEHELNAYTCNSKDDCNGDDGVTCGFTSGSQLFKVCKCEDGYLLDPKLQKCVNDRCSNCTLKQDFECVNYQCRCKNGYYPGPSGCVKYTVELALNQVCNPTAFRPGMTNNTLVCDPTCERAQCTFGYRPEEEYTKCVQYQLKDDKCIHRETICKTIDDQAICDREANQCLCSPSLIADDNKCKKGVGAVCTNSTDCGDEMDCVGDRCVCNEGSELAETTDSEGRPVQYCTNGIGKILFNPVLLSIFILIRLFFI